MITRAVEESALLGARGVRWVEASLRPRGTVWKSNARSARPGTRDAEADTCCGGDRAGFYAFLGVVAELDRGSTNHLLVRITSVDGIKSLLSLMWSPRALRSPSLFQRDSISFWDCIFSDSMYLYVVIYIIIISCNRM